jgi:hypothetical protein
MLGSESVSPSRRIDAVHRCTTLSAKRCTAVHNSYRGLQMPLSKERNRERMRIKRALASAAPCQEKPEDPAKRTLVTVWALLSADERVWFVGYIKALRS